MTTNGGYVGNGTSTNKSGFLFCILKYAILTTLGATFGLIIVKLSSATIVFCFVLLLIILLLCGAIEISFHLSILALILIQEVEVTPGSFLTLVQNYKLTGFPSFLEICLSIFCAIFICKYIVQKDCSVISMRRLPLFLFMLCYGIALYTGMSDGNNGVLIKEDAKKFMLPVVYFIACLNVLDSKEKIHRLVGIVSVATLMKLLLAIFSYIRGTGFVYGNAQVVFLETADLLVVVTVSVVLIAFFVYQPLTAENILFPLVLGAPLIFALIYSNRRNAWLGIILALLMLFALTPVKMKLRFGTVLAVAVFVGLSMAAIAMPINGVPSSDVLASRFASISDKTDKSNEAHLNEWAVTIDALREHPVLGLGFGGEHAPVPGDDTINRHTVHNAFLMLYMKMGILSVLLFGWCLFQYLNSSLHNLLATRDRLSDPLMVGLLSTFAYWMVTLNVAPSWWYYRETCLMALVGAIVIRSTSFPVKTVGE